MFPSFVTPAVVSGIFAASVSLVAKLALAGRDTLKICMNLERYLRKEEILDHLECPTVVAYVRLTCFCCILLFNAIMWTYFSKALQKARNSVQPVIVNTATNFFLSAFYGFVFYHETLSLTWFMGATLIIIGLAIISHSGVELVDSEDIKLD